MRPASITLFERLFLLSLAIGAIQVFVGWDELLRRAEAKGEGAAALTALLALAFFIQGALALLVSRGRMWSAKWLLVILCAIGLPLVLASVAEGTIVGWVPVALLQAALQVASLALLFTREAREWVRVRA